MTAILYDSAVPKRKPELLPLFQVHKQLGIGEATLWRWIRQGYLTPYKSPTDRRTWLDINAVKEFKEHPPLKPVKRSPNDG